MRRRRWTIRLVVAAVGCAAAYAVALIVHTRPDGVRLALVSLLVVAVAGLVVDTTSDDAASWEVASSAPVTPRGMDSGLAHNVRLLEHHLTSRSVDPGVRDRLGELAGQRLARHGVRLTDPEAARLLGPELTGVIQGPLRRLTVTEIDRCVERIESL